MEEFAATRDYVNRSGGRESLRSYAAADWLRMTSLVLQHRPGRTERAGPSLFFFRQLALKHVLDQRLQHTLRKQIVQLRLELLKHSRHHCVHCVLVHFA